MWRRRLLVAMICAAGAFAGLAAAWSVPGGAAPATTTATTPTSGPLSKPPHIPPHRGKPPRRLVVSDWIVGTGPKARDGDALTTDYLGAFYGNGKVFDSSWGPPRQPPFVFTLGAGVVIAGWDRGLVGMRVGGRRELIIPPRLAYGAKGSPPTVPRNATLVYVVDLLGVQTG